MPQTDFSDQIRQRLLDQHVVSLLLENPDFALVTHQISNFINGALSAGLTATTN